MYRYSAPLSKWRRRTRYITVWKPRRSSRRCCVGNPLRPQGRVIYWAPTLQPSLHLLAEDLSADPYSLMIITDHLPKWLINKAEAKQIIYLYGSVDIKFRVDGLKRIKGPWMSGDGWLYKATMKIWPFLINLQDPAFFVRPSSSCLPMQSFLLLWSLFTKAGFLPRACVWQQSANGFERSKCQMEEYLNCSFVPNMQCVLTRPHMPMRDLWIMRRHWNDDDTNLSKVWVSLARIFHHGMFFINHTNCWDRRRSALVL